MKTVVIVSGGFDPIHAGHIYLLNNAKALGNFLMVGVNSDQWLARKKGKPFMDIQERKLILANLKSVDGVVEFNDDDGSACDLIKQVIRWRPPMTEKIIFANGGDRTKENIPEMGVDYGFPVEFVFGIGGDNKTNSSSWLLDRWKEK
jgi:cytidyltransferase-like protein